MNRDPDTKMTPLRTKIMEKIIVYLILLNPIKDISIAYTNFVYLSFSRFLSIWLLKTEKFKTFWEEIIS